MPAAKKVLIVEDEPAIADNITYALKTEGFDPVWASTGEEAFRVFQADDIALIILDVGLPDVNGFDLCKQIRDSSQVPIIFLTARSDEVDRVVGLEIGADDYVVKPFSPRELSARIKAILRRTVPAEATGSGARDFKIDTNRLLLSYYGELLELSRYEYRILEILINRRGWVYSRDQLMEMAWEEPEMSLDRTIDAHIKTIRAKLKKIRPEQDPIKTHRGIGYSMREPE